MLTPPKFSVESSKAIRDGLLLLRNTEISSCQANFSHRLPLIQAKELSSICFEDLLWEVCPSISSYMSPFNSLTLFLSLFYNPFNQYLPFPFFSLYILFPIVHSLTPIRKLVSLKLYLTSFSPFSISLSLCVNLSFSLLFPFFREYIFIFCLRPSAKVLGITRVVSVAVLFH